MSDEIDPEVLADLRLRARTERERPAVPPSALKWSPSPTIAKVPCRARCGNVTDWTEDAEDRFRIFNRELERRNEAPLDKTRIVFCLKCQEIGAKMAAERNRKHIDALAEVIKRIKASSNPEEEREDIEKLKKLNHPDVQGLLQAIRARLDAKGASRKLRKDSL